MDSTTGTIHIDWLGADVRESGHDPGVRADFEAFARENWSTLMTIGVAVTGSCADAEDVVQIALTSAWTRWRRIRRPEALAYVRRSIVNANVSRWRRQRGAELTVAEPPEPRRSADVTAGVDARETLLPMLRSLPSRQRAVLVLRYLCDLPDDEIAATLGIGAGTVRSQAHRGLATLRQSSPTPYEEALQ